MQGERSKNRAHFLVGDMMLWPEESAPSDELSQGMGLLVRSLAADARFARTAKLLPSEWARFFDAMLRAYLTVEEGVEETELRACRAAIATLEKRDAGAKIGYRIATELAREELEALPAIRGVPLGDGVVVASLLPMRAIPFRAVFVLGMGEGRFPARELDTGLDLRALGRKPGDVSIDERDRYTFLETLRCGGTRWPPAVRMKNSIRSAFMHFRRQCAMRALVWLARSIGLCSSILVSQKELCETSAPMIRAARCSPCPSCQCRRSARTHKGAFRSMRFGAFSSVRFKAMRDLRSGMAASPATWREKTSPSKSSASFVSAC
jgi:hypothetical protein